MASMSIRPFPSSRYRIFFQVVVGTRRREEDLFIKCIYNTINEGSVQIYFKFVGEDEFIAFTNFSDIIMSWIILKKFGGGEDY